MQKKNKKDQQWFCISEGEGLPSLEKAKTELTLNPQNTIKGKEGSGTGTLSPGNVRFKYEHFWSTHIVGNKKFRVEARREAPALHPIDQATWVWHIWEVK